jgi:hypothetical protein
MKLSGVCAPGYSPLKFTTLAVAAAALFLHAPGARAQESASSRILDISTIPVNHYTFADKTLMESPFEDFDDDEADSSQQSQNGGQTPAPAPGSTATQSGTGDTTTQSTTTSQTSQGKQKKAPPKGTSNDRLFYVLPNFMTLEESENVPPLTTKEKFAVTARGIYDPAEFALTGIVALLGQASNSDPSYGQGMEGYAKRYATTYGDNVIENFMASAIFPTIFRQDPRYFQLGHGGGKKRLWHAFTRAFVTRSDSGKHEFNISEIGGALAAASISTYTYHPDSDRGFGEVISVWGTQVGWDVGTYILKEFWPDLRKKYSKHRGNTANDTTTIDATPAPATTAPAQTPPPAPAPAPAPAPKY